MRCGYIRWIWDCGNTREVEEKHTGRYGARGQKRQKRRKVTPEEIAKQNQWKRERDVRRLIKWNFGIGDYWFTLTYKKAQKNTERKCAYILETICAGAIKTAEGFQCISGTYHSATLQNLVAALSRIRKTSNVCVHTEDVYVVSRIRKLPEMAAANWEDARGTRIGNAELWKRIWELIEEHRLTLTAKAGKHSYSNWLQEAMKKRKEKM